MGSKTPGAESAVEDGEGEGAGEKASQSCTEGVGEWSGSRTPWPQSSPHSTDDRVVLLVACC